MRIYDGGTVSVGSGATTVTGTGTAWAGTVRAGDMLWIAGLVCRIASVEGAAALTLAKPWPGPAVTGGAYEIQLTPSEVVYGEAVRTLVDALGASGLAALADVAADADRLPYFDGSSTGATMDFPETLRTLLAALPGLLSITGNSLVTAAAARITGGAVQSGATDTTDGRVLLARPSGGAYGLGNTGALPVAADCNALTATGFYAVATTTTNTPVASMTGTMLHITRSAGLSVQIVVRSASITGSCTMFYRTGLTPGGAWSSWIQLATV